MNLISNNYGKQRVRIMKVLRTGARHEVKELEVGVRLEGDFASSYTSGDNSLVVATDTMKNTVQVLAHRHLGPQTEPFALLLANHFLHEYAQVGRVTIETSETGWPRLTVGDQPHNHTFLKDGMKPLAKVTAARGKTPEIVSGLEDLVILKSTGSGFSGFPRDSYTTLPETDDRILATALRAHWTWAVPPADFNAANRTALAAMLRVFATEFSPSVQTTLCSMAGAALAAVPGIAKVALEMPNKHYLRANLAPFGLENPNVTFVPTDEPHGQIEAVVARQP